jgi:SAM-dependent methyltransferase
MSAEPMPPGGGGLGRLVDSVKYGVRHLADRVVEPYVERTVERVADRMSAGAPAPDAPPVPTLPPPFASCHGSLHEGRTMALADMPAGCDTVLSMGANGQWYFDWFDETYGHIPRHIGVEAYMPRPDVLPDNVEWVEADLASPEGVALLASGAVDLVFSGQNIEHLWPDQVQAFLIESNRVLRNGGWLVLDSPNRELTAEYQWSMGEHTIEFTPDEASELLRLAGFEVEAMKGIWLCRQAGELLPLEPSGTMEDSADVLRRMILATRRPEDSFIWWAEARKVGEPDVEGLGVAVRAVFAANWQERVAGCRRVRGQRSPPTGRTGPRSPARGATTT